MSVRPLRRAVLGSALLVAGALFAVAVSTSTTLACHFPATGQTTCWDINRGNVIPCASTGQDGDIQTGAPLSYTDNGDGTITDSNTGLVWEKLSIDGSVHDVNNWYSWDVAFSAHVGALNSMSFAGHTDWRLPNVRELATIANYENYNLGVSSAFNQCSSGCTVLTVRTSAHRDRPDRCIVIIGIGPS